MSTSILFVIRRRWPILVFLPILTVISVLVLTPSAKAGPPKYTATVYLAGEPSLVGSVALQQASVDVVQKDVARTAAKILGEKPTNLEKFVAPISTKVDAEALTLKISAADTDKKRVRPFVRAFADAFVQVDSDQKDLTYAKAVAEATRARDDIEQQQTDFLKANAAALSQTPPDPALVAERTLLDQRLGAAEGRLATAQDNKAVVAYRVAGESGISRVPDAKLSLPASKPLRAMMAFVLSILGAIAIVAILERMNPRIDSPTDAEAIAGAPVLAMVPVMRGRRKRILDRAGLELFSGPFAESFRAMRSHLDFRSTAENLDRPPSVMIVSSAPGEGKTTSTAFLALSYAEVGREVVIVGADFRRPSIHRLFGLSNKPGLSSRMLSPNPDSGSEEIVRSIVKRDARTGVRVIPSGPATDRVTGLLGDLAAVTSAALSSDCTVVIDTAPIMVANDAIDFLPFVDWVIVVVRVGKTTERSLRQTITSLELNEAKIAGCVMVGSLESSDAKRYYYSYYRVEDENQPPGAPGDPSGNPAPPVAPPNGSAPAETESTADTAGPTGDTADDEVPTPAT